MLLSYITTNINAVCHYPLINVEVYKFLLWLMCGVNFIPGKRLETHTHKIGKEKRSLKKGKSCILSVLIKESFHLTIFSLSF